MNQRSIIRILGLNLLFLGIFLLTSGLTQAYYGAPYGSGYGFSYNNFGGYPSSLGYSRNQPFGYSYNSWNQPYYGWNYSLNQYSPFSIYRVRNPWLLPYSLSIPSSYTYNPFITTLLSFPPSGPSFVKPDQIVSVPKTTIVPVPNAPNVPGNSMEPTLFLFLEWFWRSEIFTDQAGYTIKGQLNIDRSNTLLEMAGSLLPLGKGDLIEFQYTPTYGYAPVWFKVKFYSGYVGEFTGRIYNTLVLFMDSGDPDFGKIIIEGKYTIKDILGITVDTGTFDNDFQSFLRSP